MDLKKLFGKNLQKYRKLRKLTQEKLAELVGVDATSISSVETGKFFPTADNLQKIAGALNIKLETLFDFEDFDSDQKNYDEIIGLINDFKQDKIKMNALRHFVHSLV